MKYKVSCIIVNYNNGHTLRRAIESVLCQITGYSFEVIVVDDGSSDNSTEILEDYWDYDNVLILPQRHRGLMRTYGRALQLCHGEYIMFCDSDDRWAFPHKIQQQVKFMDNNPSVGLCVTKCYIESAGERQLMGKKIEELQEHLTFDDLLRGTANLHSPTLMIRKSEFDRYINFDKFIRLGFHVWDLPIDLELINHTKLTYLEMYTATWVKYPESATMTASRWKKLKLVLGYAWIKTYYIFRFGCKFSTLHFVTYKLLRDIISIILKRWTNN